MKAILQGRYGSPDVLTLGEADVPVLDAGRVLVRVHAASVNAGDWHRLRGEPFLVRTSEGLRKPKVSLLGSDVAGVVEAIAPDVTEFTVGQRVFGTTAGAFAEIARAREVRLVAIPDGFSFEQAAAVPVAATTALQALRDHGQVKAGQRVLIHGAGGGVGTFAVQLAKHFGAVVTAVSSTANLDMLRSIGADDVIDYTQEDFTQRRGSFDVIVDISGTRSIGACRRALTHSGTYVMIGGPGGRWLKPMDRMLKVVLLKRFVSQRLVWFLAQITKDDLVVLRDLMAAGALNPVIDRTYPLSQVPDAIRHVEAGRARGKVIITV